MKDHLVPISDVTLNDLGKIIYFKPFIVILYFILSCTKSLTFAKKNIPLTNKLTCDYLY